MNGEFSPTPADPRRLGRLWFEAVHTLQAAQMGEGLALMNDSGLTLPQIIALHVLQTHGPYSVGAIAARVKLSAAATSHLVDRLVGLGLVERSEHAADRRQKRVALSRKGSLLVERLGRARCKAIERALRRLSPELRARLAEVLGEILAELGQERGRMDSGGQPEVAP